MLMLITVMADTVDMADTVTDTVMADTAMDTVMAVTVTDTARDLLNPKLTVMVMAMDTDMVDTAVDTAVMVDTATVDVITDKLF